MISFLKKRFYFLVARYFRFFAKIRLKKWKPRIIVITGSNGKTTALHLLEAQLDKTARYSHHANSTFGIPFDILSLHRQSYSPWEWVGLILRAPFNSQQKPYKENIYVVEADCDRPYEGKFLGDLLRPETVLWISQARTHTKNFEKQVQEQKFTTVDEAIAYEFGHLARAATKQVLYNADNKHINREMRTVQANGISLSIVQLKKYTATTSGTTFATNTHTYTFPYLLPRETFYPLSAMETLLPALGQDIEPQYKRFTLPPGRSSLFSGKKQTTIIDSSYNINISSLAAILHMVRTIKHPKKWLVLGDMTEQGTTEAAEHQKIAGLIDAADFAKIILVGPRLERHTIPALKKKYKQGQVVHFLGPREALEYLKKNLSGGELILFKGARFLEGIIEQLLINPKDADKLCRREPIWKKRRAQWGV